MGLLSHKVKRSDLEPGDHIYVYRAGGTYSHHGEYVGNDMVVHLSLDKKSSASSSCSCSLSLWGHGCGFRKDGSAVTMTCLDRFLNNGSLCRYEYGVSKVVFTMVKHRPGTCTMAESDDAEKVIHRAKYLLENGFGNYNFLRNNCELFALYCKTGLLISYHRRPTPTVGGSGQATAAFLVPTGVVTFGHTGFMATAIATGAFAAPLLPALFVAGVVGGTVAAGFNTALRYKHDISERTGDVYKVEVESLEEFRRNHSAT
ncbi:hypothetical protein C2S51_014545 [Perilla frutescens var. frutescens]|nr:hypothetical protein C2S51_014545 [Perilla frutescens var. frutescens]